MFSLETQRQLSWNSGYGSSAILWQRGDVKLLHVVCQLAKLGGKLSISSLLSFVGLRQLPPDAANPFALPGDEAISPETPVPREVGLRGPNSILVSLYCQAQADRIHKADHDR